MAGIKFVIKGTIKGRNRSVIFTLFQGQMPVQTLDTNIVYHFQKCITQFGVFGIRL